ncbi:pentatricopeptide repeat-containing protein At2g20540-like [Typha latifolia]|uniref:pentatricopeptide repeat-containing protein At2g20540-like n=1 Tax=Typha latifolia TaxID=4733 RepID=UPI003C2B704E
MPLFPRPLQFYKPYSRPLQQRLFLLLQTCKSKRQLNQIHAQLLLNGFSQKSFLLTKLLSFCIASGDLPYAVAAFSYVDKPSTTLSNQMLRAFSLSPKPRSCLLFYTQVLQGREGIRPNGFTYAFLLSACARAGASFLSQGEQLHGQIVSAGFDSNVYVRTNLINMYAKEEIASARKVFDEMPQQNMVSWNSMLVGYMRSGDLDAASGFFSEMRRRDAVSWTTMIAGFAQAGKSTQSLELFREMRRRRVTPDQVTMVALLSACADLGDLELGKWIHGRIDSSQRGKERLVSVNNALIQMYAKCGDVEEAGHIFRVMRRRTTLSWTTMIAGLAMHGRFDDALELFDKMLEKPDTATYLAVLMACSHSGRVNDGWRRFEDMARVHGIRPEMRHYTCMVDMLSRANRLPEALELVETMPVRADEVFWGALLGGCGRNGEVELASYVVDRLVEIKPEKAAGHLLFLANVYAAVSKWEEARRARERMVELGVRKPLGLSWTNPIT